MKYSILIPVQDTIGPLRSTIETCIRQELIDDYEVVISDNGSTDDIKSLVESFQDKHLAYYRNPKTGTQADSFELAVFHAKGDYCLMLGADDALSKWALYIIDRIMSITGEEVIRWWPNRYFWPERDDYPNALWIPEETRQYKFVDSKKQLDEIFAGKVLWEYPSLYQHSVIKTEILRNADADLRQHGMRLFDAPMPDNYQGVMTLLYTDHFFEIPYSLITNGQSQVAKSSSAALLGKELKALYVDEASEKRLKKEPFYSEKQIYCATFMYHSQASALQILKDRNVEPLPSIRHEKIIDCSVTQVMCQYEFILIENEKFEALRSAFFEYIKNSIEKIDDAGLAEWFDNTYAAFKDGKVNRRLMRNIHDTKINHIVQCENFGIKNIAQAQELMDNIYLSKYEIDKNLEQLEYVYERSKTLALKMKELDEEGGLAIYGIGGHTEALLHAFHHFCGEFKNPVVFLDSDRNKKGSKYHECPVYHPDDIPELSISGIVLSSLEYQWLMYSKVKKYEDELEIVMPYEVADLYYLKYVGF